MRTRIHPPRIVDLGLMLGLVLGGIEARAQPQALTEQIEVRLVRVPVRLEPTQPGGCDNLTGDDFVILEDGAPARSLHLDPKPVDAVHAILLDTSISMLESFSNMKRAVTAYVDSLPDDQPVLLATFDSSLVLQAPLSTDRKLLDASLDWIEVGDQSHLWDSTRQLLRFLRSRPERKVLIVITDGCDTQRNSPALPHEVTDLAVGSDSLVVFTVGLNLPASCEGSAEDPARTLREFAESTGGSFNRLKSASALTEALTQIRLSTASEHYIVYEPLPFGKGPKDNPRKQQARWRRIKLRTEKKAGCTVSLTGARVRYESATREFFGTTLETGEIDSTAAFELAEAGDRLFANIIDIVNDGGIAPDPLGQRLVRTESKRRIAQRSVEVLIPPIESVVRKGARPEDVLFHALAAAADSSSKYGSWFETPFLVNGRTLLDARRSLSNALASHPDYGAWAFERIRDERLAMIDELIRTRSRDEDRSTLTRVREILADETWTPEPLEYEKHLAAWLGDVRPPELFNAAELWLARRLITASVDDREERLPIEITRAARLWSNLRAWLPGAEQVRSIGFLVPGYGPDLDAVGFYRVLLAPATSHEIHTRLSGADSTTFLGSELVDEGHGDRASLFSRLQRSNHSAEEPLGVRMVEWMLRQPGLAEVTQRLTLRGVGYAHPTEKDLFPLFREVGFSSELGDVRRYLARQVTLIFSPREESSRNLVVTAYFPFDLESRNRYAAAPVCVVLPAEAPSSVTGQRLYRGLVAAIRRTSIPCVLRSPGPAR